MGRLLPLLVVCACAAPPRAVEAEAWEALRGAALAQERPAAWAVRGEYRDGAGGGQFTDLHARDGRFARRHRSRLPGGAGDDGARAWSLGIDGLARPASGRAADEARVTAAVLSGAWLAGPFEVSRLADHSFALALDGAPVASLAVDPTTSLPRELTFERAGGARALELGDWRAPLGFPVAHQIELRDPRGPIASWRVREVMRVDDPDFAPPPAPDDARFEDAPAELHAMRAGARLLVRAACDGDDAGWWLVDSGAGASAVDPALAERLGWPSIGDATLVGAGGRAARGLRRAGALGFGPLVVEGLPLIEADAGSLSRALGTRVSGVLGADVLGRCVLELDFGAGRAWMLDPAHWTPPTRATPVTLDGVVPLLEARFAPDHAGRLRLDTGSDDTLTFHGPTVRRLGLTHRREDLVSVRVTGVGGDVLGDRGPLEWLEVGGRRFSRPQVTYLRHSTGGLARADVAGNLGAGLFADGRLVLALPHGCIVVE